MSILSQHQKEWDEKLKQDGIIKEDCFVIRRDEIGEMAIRGEAHCHIVSSNNGRMCACELKSLIHSREEALLERVREEIERWIKNPKNISVGQAGDFRNGDIVLLKRHMFSFLATLTPPK